MLWLAIWGSLFISIVGIIIRRPYFLVFGAILSLGFAWYLTMLPLILFKLIGYTLPLFHLTAMFFVLRGDRSMAGLLLIPNLAIAVYFGIGVLFEGYHH